MDATKDSGGESQIRDICNRLSLELPDILYVFGLIRTRLDEELKRVSRLSGSIPVSTFRHIRSKRKVRSLSSSMSKRFLVIALDFCSFVSST